MFYRKNDSNLNPAKIHTIKYKLHFMSLSFAQIKQYECVVNFHQDRQHFRIKKEALGIIKYNFTAV